MYQRSFMKWAGNKYGVLDKLLDTLPSSTKLIEPFLGSGSVFLNTGHKKYILNDANPDLINVFRCLKEDPTNFIKELKFLFNDKLNCSSAYYRLRSDFNSTEDSFYKTLLFVYLNRHGYQGLCRYSKSTGFNVPYGHYKSVHFPEEEMVVAALKVKRAKLMSENYSQAFRRARAGDVIYCDPPYFSLSKTANFTNYTAGGFCNGQQLKLAKLGEQARERGVHVVISNHDPPIARNVYTNASNIISLDVRRSINSKSSKKKSSSEIIVSYTPSIDYQSTRL